MFVGQGLQIEIFRFQGGAADPAQADQAWFLVPGGPVEGFAPRNGYVPVSGGRGASWGRCAIVLIPYFDSNVLIRNFFRDSPASPATDSDPTATDGLRAIAIDGLLVAG